MVPGTLFLFIFVPVTGLLLLCCLLLFHFLRSSFIYFIFCSFIYLFLQIYVHVHHVVCAVKVTYIVVTYMCTSFNSCFKILMYLCFGCHCSPWFIVCILVVMCPLVFCHIRFGNPCCKIESCANLCIEDIYICLIVICCTKTCSFHAQTDDGI